MTEPRDHPLAAGRTARTEQDIATGPAGHDTDWDEVYGGEQVWSGNVNDALVAVMAGDLADLPVGRALDIGCGEGADAIYLATRGWLVTALDVAGPALERGRESADRQGDDVASRIEWVQAGLLEAALPPASFDLVSVFYPALLRSQDDSIEWSLRELVRPGGALIVVAHAFVDRERALAHGFDPDDYVSIDDIVTHLGDGWQIERRESERHVTEGAGAHHHVDLVLVARRAEEN